MAFLREFLALCRRLCPSHPLSWRHPVLHRPICGCLQMIWPHHQPQKNWGHVPIGTLPGPCHTTAPTPNTEIKTVEKFYYLGSTLSNNGCLDWEVTQRTAKASSVFGRLTQRLAWSQVPNKDSNYQAVVLSALLYCCEKWTPYHRHIQQLEQSHQRCLSRICNIRWQDSDQTSGPEEMLSWSPALNASASSDGQDMLSKWMTAEAPRCCYIWTAEDLTSQGKTLQ